MFKAKNERHLARLDGLEERFRLGLSKAANVAGRALSDELEQGMKTANVPSDLGGYPGVRTGQLISSVGYEVSGHRFLRFGQGPAMRVSFDYAIGTHEGTSKMAPRPGVKIAVDAKKDDIERILGQVTWRFIVGG